MCHAPVVGDFLITHKFASVSECDIFTFEWYHMQYIQLHKRVPAVLYIVEPNEGIFWYATMSHDIL